MKIYFVYENIVTGGCELLIERLCRELKRRSIFVEVICKSLDEMMSNRFTSNNISYYKISKWDRKNLFSIVGSEKTSYLITFTWNDFLICNIKKKNIHTFFYAVHYQAFEMGKNRQVLIKSILYKIARNGIIRLNRNGQLICMDEQTIENTKQYYGYNDMKIPIIRIAVDVILSEKKIVDSSKINILTIARSDFPFKGYILGLLEWFQNSYSNVQLIIVSYGKDEYKISDKIASFDEPLRKRIKLVGKTDYTELEKYYRMADLYVGMGTTILDASLRGIVSIPVKAYTFDLITDKFFVEDYTKVAIDQGSKSKFDELVSRYIELTNEEKKLLSKKCRNTVIEKYGTSKIVDSWISILENAPKNCSTIGLNMLQKYHMIKRIIKAN